MWESVWAFAVSEAWQRLKQDIIRALLPLDPARLHEHDIWKEVFASINTATELFHIAVSTSNSDHFIINLPVSLENVQYTPYDQRGRNRVMQQAEKETGFRAPIQSLVRHILKEGDQPSAPGEDTGLSKGLDYPNF